MPTTAHVHLPYQGADNGVYARTLLFAWDAFSPPGKHFRKVAAIGGGCVYIGRRVNLGVNGFGGGVNGLLGGLRAP